MKTKARSWFCPRCKTEWSESVYKCRVCKWRKKKER